MVTRTGHSLPEMIVTLAFLAATLGAVSAGALAAARTTAAAVDRQDALAVASAALDSLLTAEAIIPEAGQSGRWRVEWRRIPSGDGYVLRVHASDPHTGRRAVVESFWAPPPPVLEGGS